MVLLTTPPVLTRHGVIVICIIVIGNRLDAFFGVIVMVENNMQECKWPPFGLMYAEHTVLCNYMT